MTKSELLKRMTSHELSEWMAFYKISPFGEARADFRNAIACTTINNVLSKRKKRPKDFMPYFSRFKKEMHWQKIKQILQQVCEKWQQ